MSPLCHMSPCNVPKLCSCVISLPTTPCRVLVPCAVSSCSGPVSPPQVTSLCNILCDVSSGNPMRPCVPLPCPPISRPSPTSPCPQGSVADPGPEATVSLTAFVLVALQGARGLLPPDSPNHVHLVSPCVPTGPCVSSPYPLSLYHPHPYDPCPLPVPTVNVVPSHVSPPWLCTSPLVSPSLDTVLCLHTLVMSPYPPWPLCTHPLSLSPRTRLCLELPLSCVATWRPWGHSGQPSLPTHWR